MLSILISINPGWCRLIESGKKKIEVRKTRPKYGDIFKVYIYETKVSGHIPQLLDTSKYDVHTGRGAVIGEFFCNRVVPIKVEYSDTASPIADAVFPLRK